MGNPSADHARPCLGIGHRNRHVGGLWLIGRRQAVVTERAEIFCRRPQIDFCRERCELRQGDRLAAGIGDRRGDPNKGQPRVQHQPCLSARRVRDLNTLTVVLRVASLQHPDRGLFGNHEVSERTSLDELLPTPACGKGAALHVILNRDIAAVDRQQSLCRGQFAQATKAQRAQDNNHERSMLLHLIVSF